MCACVNLREKIGKEKEKGRVFMGWLTRLSISNENRGSHMSDHVLLNSLNE